MITNTFIAYALGAAVLVPFLIGLLFLVPSWGSRNISGYHRSAVRVRSRGGRGR